MCCVKCPADSPKITLEGREFSRTIVGEDSADRGTRMPPSGVVLEDDDDDDTNTTVATLSEPVDLDDAESRQSYDAVAELEAVRTTVARSEAAASDHRPRIGQGCTHCFHSLASLVQSGDVQTDKIYMVVLLGQKKANLCGLMPVDTHMFIF